MTDRPAPPDPPASPGPPQRLNIASHLLALNRQRSSKPAFIDDHGSLSYGALDDGARRLSAALAAGGLQRGDRALLLMHDGCDWPLCFLGPIHAGVLPVAVNPLLTAADIAYMLAHAQARAVFVSAALLPLLGAALAAAAAGTAGMGPHAVTLVIVAGAADGTTGPAAPPGTAPRQALQEVQPLQPLQTLQPLQALIDTHAPAADAADTGADEAAFWLYSSGSTGRPKATVHAHASVWWTAALYGSGVLGLREGDVCFSAAKLFFAYGLGNALTFPMSVGATTLLMAERPTPEACFRRWLGAVPPTVFYGAPTGFAALLAHPGLPPRDAVALRLVSSAGEALPAEIGRRFLQHFGVPIVDGIGSTEMLHIFLSNRPDRVRHGSTGWPVPGYSVALRGDDGGPVADGEPGDLFIQGPSAALLYWGDPEKTRDTFQHGWTKSGDKYIRNADDGSYTYGGRSDDMLKVSGIYVSPFEVEATLVQHPAVLEAAVVGRADAQGLTKALAYVVLKPGADSASADEAALKAFVKQRLAPYKQPRQIVFVAELPKTATGKIQRFKLRALDDQGVAVAAVAAVATVAANAAGAADTGE